MRSALRWLYVRWIRAGHSTTYTLASRFSPSEFYQPIYGHEDDRQSTRACRDRWDALEPFLDAGETVLDLGSNLGYFTFKSAEQGKVAFGVERDDLWHAISVAIQQSRKMEHTAFLHTEADRDLLEKLPPFDIVFHLSLFHHWVRRYGAKEAQALMRIVSEKCNDCLFFETGQSNETEAPWADELSFMGAEPRTWIEGFLTDLGFEDVEHLGTFPTGLTPVDRHLFVASNPSSEH